MSKTDDVDPLKQLALRHQEPQEPPAKGSVLQLCLVILFKHFLAGLVMGGGVFLLSLFSTGDRAAYLRWMSLAPIPGLMLMGLAQVIRVFDGPKNRDRKNRDTI